MLNDRQKQIQAEARELAQNRFAARAAEIDQSEEYPWDNIELLCQAGFMGMTIPQEYGGRGFNYLDVVVAIEQFAAVCATMGRITVEANMGAIGAIMAYGSEAQKKLVAPYVLAGDKPAICITEPGAGSAATEMATRAEKKDGRYVLNGTKYWITGGGVSKVHLIFARVIEDGEDLGIGGFIYLYDGERGDGFRVGAREPAMGVRGIPETYLHLENLEIDADMLVVPPEGLRRGFAGLMNAYNSQRVGAGTVALGIAAGAYATALAYVREREQFGRPIAEFQGLQWMIADMRIGISAAQALVYKAAANAGDGFPDMNEAAQAKIFAAETANTVTNQALQLHGSMGYSRNLPLERHVRDARMFTIAGGTAQILRTQVASVELGMKIPQTRDGFSKLAERRAQ
jgi:alkylation response protein AidB-like acyl-CoA dehydrogenase